MLLAAQRVISSVTRKHGINVYQYLHGDSWDGPAPSKFLPDHDPGALMHAWEQLLAGGNRVVSFLDLVAPDEIDPLSLHQSLASLKYQIDPATSLLGAHLGPYWLRFRTTTVVPPQIELGALAGTILLRLTGY